MALQIRCLSPLTTSTNHRPEVPLLKRQVLALIFCSLAATSSWSEPNWTYPMTTKEAHSDTYHGTVVEDPYHWLEDDHSAQTAEWVKAQNQLTFGYLEKIPFRSKVRERLLQLNNYPRFGQPFRRGNTYIFQKNDGLQKQSVYYVQQGLNGKPEVLLDPNTLSADGTASVAFFAVDKSGKYAAYGVGKGGSDWKDIFVIDIATRKTLSDKVEWAKVTGASWAQGGFFYSRYDAPKDGHNLSAKNENHKVYFHKVGTPQGDDQLIYEDPANPQRFHTTYTSDDEKYLFVDISDRGKGKDGNAIFYKDLTDPKSKILPLIPEVGEDDFSVADVIDGKFLIFTSHKAPRGRAILIDPKHIQEKHWKTFIPEGKEVLKGLGSAGDKIFAVYLKDVSSHINVHGHDGKLENQVQLPGLGTASGFGGQKDDTTVFYTFSSYNYPSTIFQYDLKSKKSSVFRKPELAFEPSNYEVEQIFYPSKDGTKIPMFLVHRKGIKKDGNNPVWLYAYGGFNISLTPAFNPAVINLLDQGFIYAVANLRGGGEYGEDWHKAGMLDKKQNVFDDFIWAAEYLIKQRYTRSGRLAIQGGSNGGLLVGAVMNQRPDLFRVGLPGVGVMDMLRFQKFTIGWNWSPEYGSSDDPKHFKNLFGYSPLHNIKANTDYPCIMVTTADHDDRVVPAHSFKYAATLQDKVNKTNPALIRIDTNSGHGASNLLKGIDLNADLQSFVMKNVGVEPKY